MRQWTTALGHVLAIAVMLTCQCFVATFGFQLLSRPVVLQRRQQIGHHHISSYPPHDRRQRRQQLQLFNTRIATKSTASSSSALHAFNLNNPNNNPINDLGPIKDWKDVLQRLKLVVVTVSKKFISGYVTGYVLAMIWGIFRPTHLERGMLWGLDFGALSAIFTGSNTVTELFFVKGGGGDGESSESAISTNNKRRQTIYLWNVVIRNIMFALYFGRNGGLIRMIRSAVLYGGLTYYFVSKKIKRDATMGIYNFQNMMGGMGGGGLSSNPQQAAAMQELFRQLSKNNPTTTTTTFTTSQSQQQQRPSSSPSKKKPSSSSSSPLNTNNVVDVEFEKVQNEDDVDGEDDSQAKK